MTRHGQRGGQTGGQAGGQTDRQAQTGRRAALVISGTAALWVLTTLIGAQLGLSNRILALFDMLALAGFVWAFWMIYNIWRMRQDRQGQ